MVEQPAQLGAEDADGVFVSHITREQLTSQPDNSGGIQAQTQRMVSPGLQQVQTGRR
jgi:hypothetical protein